MVSATCEIQSLEDLRRYVVELMCKKEQLLSDSFKLTERVLVQNGRPCGLYFCLHGPRALKISAVWETKRNTVLFYGPTGERFQKTQLVNARKAVRVRI